MISAGLSIIGVALSLFGLVALFDMFVAPVPFYASRIIVGLLAFVGGFGMVVLLGGLAVHFVT